jgi:triose/dihydroxyacetone kinase / FAD-AMP lyase (cyclizing)
MGASLTHVHVPGRAVSTDELDTNEEIEIGMGFHNEEGFERVKADLSGLVQALLKQLLDSTDKDRGFMEVAPGEPGVSLVNNLGDTSPLEPGAATLELVNQLSQSYGITPVRVLSGTYVSSLNGLGFSATLLGWSMTDSPNFSTDRSSLADGFRPHLRKTRRVFPAATLSIKVLLT